MEISRTEWFFNGFLAAWFIVSLICITCYFVNKSHYKQYDEEIVYRIKDAWREDSENVYMGRVMLMNVKAKCAMDHFTNMGYKVEHIGNTAFGGIPFKEITFTKKLSRKRFLEKRIAPRGHPGHKNPEAMRSS